MVCITCDMWSPQSHDSMWFQAFSTFYHIFYYEKNRKWFIFVKQAHSVTQTAYYEMRKRISLSRTLSEIFVNVRVFTYMLLNIRKGSYIFASVYDVRHFVRNVVGTPVIVHCRQILLLVNCMIQALENKGATHVCTAYFRTGNQ